MPKTTPKATTEKKNTLKDLTFDKNNANKGTARGRAMLETSLQKYGAGRSILIDKNGVIIAGNKTAEVAGGIGLENVRIVETDGKEIIAVKRMDLDLSKDKAAKELAIADNRVGEVDLEWDAEEISRAQAEGMDMKDFFVQDEIDKIIDKKTGANKSDMSDDQEYPVQVSILYFKSEDWIEWKNKIVNYLNDNKIEYRIKE